MTFRDITSFNISGAIRSITSSISSISSQINHIRTLGSLSRVTTSARPVNSSDIGVMLYSDLGSLVTFTINPNIAQTGDSVHVLRYNSGSARIVAGTGVTIYSVVGTSTSASFGTIYLRARYSSATLIHMGSNVWVAVGDLGTS